MMSAIYLLILHALYVNGEGSNMAGYTSIGTTSDNDDVHQVDNTVSFYPNEMFSLFTNHKHGRRSKKRNSYSSSHGTVSIAGKFPGVAKFNESDDMMTPDLTSDNESKMPFSAPRMPFPSNDLTSRTEGFFMDNNKPITLDNDHNSDLQTGKRTHSVSSNADGQQQPEPEPTQLAGFTSMSNHVSNHGFRSNRRAPYNFVSMLGNDNLPPPFIRKRDMRRQRRKHPHKRRRVDQRINGRRRNMFNLQRGYNGMASFFPDNRMASNFPANRMASNFLTNSLLNNIPANSMASNFPSSRMASYHSGNRMMANNFGSNRLGNDDADNSMAINFLADKLASSLRRNDMASKVPVNGREDDQYNYIKKSSLESYKTKEHGKHHIAKKS